MLSIYPSPIYPQHSCNSLPSVDVCCTCSISRLGKVERIFSLRLLDLVGVSHLLVGLRLELVFVVDILGSVRGEDISSSFVVAMTSDGDETLPSTFCVWHGIGFSCFLLGLWKLRNLKKI